MVIYFLFNRNCRKLELSLFSCLALHFSFKKFQLFPIFVLIIFLCCKSRNITFSSQKLKLVNPTNCSKTECAQFVEITICMKIANFSCSEYSLVHVSNCEKKKQRIEHVFGKFVLFFFCVVILLAWCDSFDIFYFKFLLEGRNNLGKCIGGSLKFVLDLFDFNCVLFS